MPCPPDPIARGERPLPVFMARSHIWSFARGSRLPGLLPVQGRHRPRGGPGRSGDGLGAGQRSFPAAFAGEPWPVFPLWAAARLSRSVRLPCSPAPPRERPQHPDAPGRPGSSPLTLHCQEDPGYRPLWTDAPTPPASDLPGLGPASPSFGHGRLGKPPGPEEGAGLPSLHKTHGRRAPHRPRGARRSLLYPPLSSSGERGAQLRPRGTGRRTAWPPAGTSLRPRPPHRRLPAVESSAARAHWRARGPARGLSREGGKWGT